ncbi:MAG: glycosyltransferase [Terrimicrobiaceae bacterium]|nr:glycosyltransferase [Terrimicrobiaceae bacterium]
MPDRSLVVSLVVPIFNDADVLGSFLKRASDVLASSYAFYEIILVDDGSTDGTAKLVGSLLEAIPRIRYLGLTRRFGREIAISAGLETSIGDFVVVAVAGVDPIERLPELVRRCRNGSGVLCGLSTIPLPESPFSKRLSTLFHAYCRKALGFDYRENATDFRVLSRQAVNAITRIRDRHRYLKVFTVTMGFEVDFFDYEPSTRAGRATFSERLNHAIEIAIANSRHPLRFVSRLGLLLSGLNVVYAGYVVVIYLFKRDVAEGWTTLSLQMTGMFFFLFLILAVLCEYIGRILEETQDRPLYFVATEKNSSVLLENSIEKNILNDTTLADREWHVTGGG